MIQVNFGRFLSKDPRVKADHQHITTPEVVDVKKLSSSWKSANHTLHHFCNGPDPLS